MSAAANAAGYLYAHGQLPLTNLKAQAGPKLVLPQGQSQPVKPARTPRIEYRKRRYYPLPSAA